ncbi:MULTISPECIES: hypothetical protein [unclassified Methylobacterium]|uniref:hypothetical protein n=1 Tax=unclassified Methylobacterium TaxID=2615210 RepID=UPI0011C1E42C|nr:MULTISPECIES: hypothetical protein [unclassified Methylobacterium]QEE39835.1 hypothetical protein FVA80_13605 [Methylobacterium sp. WL1]TXN57321.1 hypothetical protein FV241_11705 [Methylobacterium sp. WL2]
MSTHLSVPSDDLAFPTPQTHLSRSDRVARDKAADRARRWREEQRQAIAVDAAIVAGLAASFARGTVGQDKGEVPVTAAGVKMRTIIREAARAFRDAGGDWETGARLIAARLNGSVSEVARGP